MAEKYKFSEAEVEEIRAARRANTNKRAEARLKTLELRAKVFLEKLSEEFPDDLILLCYDGASWHKIEIHGDSLQYCSVLHLALHALADAGYISSSSYGSRGMELFLPGDGAYDLSTIEGVISAHEQLGEMLDIVADKVGSENAVYDALFAAYSKCTEAVESYQDVISALKCLMPRLKLHGTI